MTFCDLKYLLQLNIIPLHNCYSNTSEIKVYQCHKSRYIWWKTVKWLKAKCPAVISKIHKIPLIDDKASMVLISD